MIRLRAGPGFRRRRAGVDRPRRPVPPPVRRTPPTGRDTTRGVAATAAEGAATAATTCPAPYVERHRRRWDPACPGSGRVHAGAAGLDEESLGGGHEHALALDEPVQAAELVAVAVGGEARHGPGHLAQEVHDGGHVEELDPERAGLAGRRPRARPPRRCPRPQRAAALVHRLRPHHEVGQLPIGAGADLLGQIRPARPQHPGDLIPQHDDGVAAHHEVERRVGEGQCRRVGHRDHVGAHGRRRAGPPRRWAATTRWPPGVPVVASPWPAPPRPRSPRRAPPRRRPCAPPAGGRSPRAGAPRWPGRRTRRSPNPRPGPRCPPPRAPRTSLRHAPGAPPSRSGTTGRDVGPVHELAVPEPRTGDKAPPGPCRPAPRRCCCCCSGSR